MATSHENEVDRNFDAFQVMLPNLIADYRGQYALMRQQKMEGVHRTLRSALEAASAFADNAYSVQKITDRPADLGLFSHAVNTQLA